MDAKTEQFLQSMVTRYEEQRAIVDARKPAEDACGKKIALAICCLGAVCLALMLAMILANLNPVWFIASGIVLVAVLIGSLIFMGVVESDGDEAREKMGKLRELAFDEVRRSFQPTAKSP